MSAQAAPISASERIHEIDILRGFALFGILLVNLASYGHSFYHYVMLKTAGSGFLDQAATFLIAFLGEGKFYALFSFLFGFGLAVQMARAEARGAKFVPLYLRRLLALLGIGLVHAILLWVGDILVPYAILGFFLLLFRKARPRTLLIWSIAMLMLALLINLGLLGLSELGRAIDPEMMDAAMQEQMAFYAGADAAAVRDYSTGSFATLTQRRLLDLTFVYPITLVILPNIFAMFLLGLAAGKQGIFQKIPAYLPLFRKLQIWGGVLGITLNLVYAVLTRMSTPGMPTSLSFLASFSQTIGAPLLSAFYLATLVLLAQDARWRARLMALAPLGRMALSNYLFQSLVFTTLFYSYGLGLYGQVGAALGLVLTVVVYLIQIPISHGWLARFHFGPVEWLWRTLTYGKAQKMRREVPRMEPNAAT